VKKPADRFREADLILLILENLVQNALEATPPGKSVEVRVTGDDATLSFAVCDEGAGLSPAVAARLFTPGPSSKKGGGGIGLALALPLSAETVNQAGTSAIPLTGTPLLRTRALPGIPAGRAQPEGRGRRGDSNRGR